MDRRNELHRLLKSLYIKGTPHVYYQPPKDQQIDYPCIIYKLDDMPAIHADNHPYLWDHRYQVTVIDRNPESPLRERVAALPTARMRTSPYAKDGLHHFIFSIYY